MVVNVLIKRCQISSNPIKNPLGNQIKIRTTEKKNQVGEPTILLVNTANFSNTFLFICIRYGKSAKVVNLGRLCFNLEVMARVCDICQKGYLKGNLVPRGIGRRVTGRTINRQKPNLRTKKIDINGQNVKVKICSSCLKRLGYEKAKAEVPADVPTADATAK